MQAHQADDQSAAFAFLADPATHGLATPVIRIDTHCAVVFLAGPNAYKVKRAVQFPFLDFSTLERRRRACQSELAVNRVNAPGLYLGMVAITSGAAGLQLSGNGIVVEWAVHMQRFDETATLDRLAGRGALTPALIDALAVAVARAHATAPPGNGAAAVANLRRVMNQSVTELEDFPAVLSPDTVHRYGVSLRGAFDQAAALLSQRAASGQVKRCHGDLHLANIALIDGVPVLFDAIEFDEAIATTDILYDLAFLLMDLWQRGTHDGANRLMRHYLLACDDEATQIAGLAALPLFMSLRAAIRAKIAAGQAATQPDQRAVAQAYLTTATQFLVRRPPGLVAIGGRSGTGKSSLAVAIAPDIGMAPGALPLRSDSIRKRLHAVADQVRLPAEAYRPEESARVYARMHELAAIALRAGQAVVLDATYLNAGEREAAERMAAACDVPFLGLWLDCPTAVAVERVALRHGDASDATPAIVRAQEAVAVAPMTWNRLDAARPLPELAQAARAILIAGTADRTEP